LARGMAPRMVAISSKPTFRLTCEVVLTESPTHLQKFVDPESGLALIRP
jgi:uncharacterized protein